MNDVTQPVPVKRNIWVKLAMIYLAVLVIFISFYTAVGISFATQVVFFQITPLIIGLIMLVLLCWKNRITRLIFFLVICLLSLATVFFIAYYLLVGRPFNLEYIGLGLLFALISVLIANYLRLKDSN